MKRLIPSLFITTHMGSYIRFLYFKKYLKKLPLENFKLILDAGCGRGEYSLYMAHLFPGKKIYAVDNEVTNFPQNPPQNAVFKRADLRRLDEEATYDFIYSIDVLEHIPENIEVLRSFGSALKYNGYLYLHMPYEKNRKYILPRKLFAEYEEWTNKEHIGQQYDLEEIKQRLEEIGFEIVWSEYSFGFLGQLAWELDKITRGKIRVLLTPLLKFFAYAATVTKHKQGNILVVAQKTWI